MTANLEPYVDADRVAAFISEPRKNVLRMARQRMLTCYPTSGRRRFTYKFKLSEVSRDIEKLRRLALLCPTTPPKTRTLLGGSRRSSARPLRALVKEIPFPAKERG